MSTRNYRGDVPLWNRLSHPQRERIKTFLLYLLLVPPIVAILFPILWMLQTALRTQAALFVSPQPIIPFVDFVPTLDTFEVLMKDTLFTTYYKNSILITAGVVVLTTVSSTLGGYGLTRLDIPFKKTFARGILAGYMFPAIMLSIPMFVLWRYVGMLNTYLGVILAETALALPFSLWLMWQFFQTVPESLEESALVGGATRFHAFKDIALPMAKPGMIAVAIFAYAIGWNNFTLPLVILTDKQMWPLTVGIQSFVRGYNILWNQVMAGTFLMIIPSFLFVLFLQSYILRGFRVRNA